MAYVPTRADATPATADFIGRMTSAGVPLSMRDTLVAMFDSILCSVGYQQKVIDTHGPSSSNTTTSTTFVNMPVGASGTFTAPVAKTYLVEVDICNAFCTVATTIIFFRLFVNGSLVSPTTGMQMSLNVANARQSLSFRQAVGMVAGANTVQLQWLAAAGSAGAAGWDLEASMVVTVVG